MDQHDFTGVSDDLVLLLGCSELEMVPSVLEETCGSGGVMAFTVTLGLFWVRLVVPASCRACGS